MYTFKVRARSSVGFGVDSLELNVRAAAKPNQPAAPTTVI
jgi:hypothetical protein